MQCFANDVKIRMRIFENIFTCHIECHFNLIYIFEPIKVLHVVLHIDRHCIWNVECFL